MIKLFLKIHGKREEFHQLIRRVILRHRHPRQAHTNTEAPSTQVWPRMEEPGRHRR